MVFGGLIWIKKNPDLISKSLGMQELAAWRRKKSAQNFEREGFARKILKKGVLRRSGSAPAGVEKSFSRRRSRRSILLIVYGVGARLEVTRGCEKAAGLCWYC